MHIVQSTALPLRYCDQYRTGYLEINYINNYYYNNSLCSSEPKIGMYSNRKIPKFPEHCHYLYLHPTCNCNVGQSLWLHTVMVICNLLKLFGHSCHGNYLL